MSSDSENFEIEDVSGSDSDAFSILSPKVKGKLKKATPSSKTATTTKSKPIKKKLVLTDRDQNPEQSYAENDSGLETLQPLPPKSSLKKKTASETYTKLTQVEHILKRPDSYIGSVETITQNMWTFDSNSKRMVLRDVKYVPGFFKIVDEILVNAADNKVNDSNMDTLKVTIDVSTGSISVYNNGRGIPIEIHSTEKLYIPELIFGHLLSSSNYDDDEKKLTGGRNGYGAKLANIYSHEFTVDTADKKTGHKYKQTWTENMGKVGKPKITNNGKNEEYTCVTFRPDLKRFGMEIIDDDTLSLLKKRVFDMAGTVKNVKVFLNNERLKVKNFKSYVDLYLNSIAAEAAETSGGAAQPKMSMIYEDVGPRWEIAFVVSEGTFQHVSFANHIATTKGGTHVACVADQIAKNLITAIGKKNKGAAVKAPQIKNHMWIFVNAMIENPTFDSQTKDTLTLPAAKFGTKPVLSEEFLKKVQKSTIIDHILNWAKFKADQQIKKTDGAKRSRLTGLPKLSDANNAGTKNASQCTLILTEGDSAKALAVAGLGVVGRDNFGVFPLRGKLLNVREAKHDQIMKNEEIQNIKKIMGLQHNKEYSSTSSLRYGRLMIMTDQDHDGSHIKGLLINFLDHFYPSLLSIPSFLVEFVTPIVRVTRGSQQKDFFTIPQYEKWLVDTPDSHKWTSKYFKGLGTSSDADSRAYFSNMAKHMIPFATVQDGDKELIELAFSKKKADERKEWLRQFRPGTYLDHDIDEIPYADFINKELILFSMADNIRSIPSIADGLKPGQRKVIWGCFRRKLKKEIKVAQLVGYISEHAAYHHGEQSLTATIVNLAQDFVGSNNLNLLCPNGQYGTREQGGKDHASPRYIFTLPANLTRTVFHEDDDALLTYLKEDADLIEPQCYVPILPMILVNGAEGIGTGWSTSIPCFNPVDVVGNLKRLIDGKEIRPMIPWWRGFKGEIKQTAEQKYDVCGTITKLNDTTVEITELPIHKWTQEYKIFLESLVGEKGDGAIKDYKEHHDNLNVHFIITMDAKALQKAEEQGLMEFFKLTGKLSTTNMICFDFDNKIKKYKSPEEILEDFYPVRLAYYQKRKDHLAKELQDQLDKLSNQARFIQMIVDNQLVVSNRKKKDIVIELRKKEFRPFTKARRAKVAADDAPDLEDESEGDVGQDADYDYLLGMPIWSLTREKIEKLRQQAAEKESELVDLLRRTPTDVWATDLDRFLEGWMRFCEEWEAAKSKDSKGRKVKRKQATLETRKSLNGIVHKRNGDDSDDDFQVKPHKAAPRPKKMVPKYHGDDADEAVNLVLKPNIKKSSATKAKSNDEPTVHHNVREDKATSSVKSGVGAASEDIIKSADEMDSDVPRPLQPPAKAKAKTAAAFVKRKSPISDQDSDSRDNVRPAKKSQKTTHITDFLSGPGSKSKPKPAAKSRLASGSKSKISKDLKSDDDVVIPDLSPPPRAATARRAAAQKTKYTEISDDDSNGSDYDAV